MPPCLHSILWRDLAEDEFAVHHQRCPARSSQPLSFVSQGPPAAALAGQSAPLLSLADAPSGCICLQFGHLRELGLQNLLEVALADKRRRRCGARLLKKEAFKARSMPPFQESLREDSVVSRTRRMRCESYKWHAGFVVHQIQHPKSSKQVCMPTRQGTLHAFRAQPSAFSCKSISSSKTTNLACPYLPSCT